MLKDFQSRLRDVRSKLNRAFQSEKLPYGLKPLTEKMPAERVMRLLSEMDIPLQELAAEIELSKVIEYLNEIEKLEDPPLADLAKAIGKDKVARFLYYLDSREDLLLYTCPPSIQGTSGAVLLNPDLKCLCEKDRKLPLIFPSDDDKECFKEAASYKLRLGSRYRVHGEQGWLSNKNRELTIPPHGIAMVTTYEWLNIPGFLIGRWNLKVKKVYKGLVWVGSLQVDPGYQGFLSCPLYNLSSKPQVIQFKETLFVIDFVLTTKFDIARDCILWPQPPGDKYCTFDFGRLDADRIMSAPEEDIASLKENIGQLKSQIWVVGAAIFSILAIIVAVLAFIPSLDNNGAVAQGLDKIPSLLFFILLVFTAMSFIWNLINALRRLSRPTKKR